MQIIIPMSGFGERFKKAGYQVPKPLIEVDGRPIISYVIDMFPGEHDFLFICNEEHLSIPHYQMREILNQYCPTGKIIAIKPHKLGPVYAVQQAFDVIGDEEPTIVNYCDFTCDWDYKHFKEWVAQVNCDGCVPAYRGFHPHSLGSTFYAYMKESDNWMLDIQEKKPFTDNPMQEFASSGTYYFASGKLLKEYFNKTIKDNLHVNGEFYVSLVYKPMVNDGLAIAIYEIPHFMQWGTPDDLREYQYYSTIFQKLAENENKQDIKINGTLLIPLAGLGNRFTRAGYDLPKPLIPVSGLPMLIQAVEDLPKFDKQVFVLRKDLPELNKIQKAIDDYYPESKQVVLEQLTDGQARTCLLAAENINLEEPLLIGACDNGALYNKTKLAAMMEDKSIDVIVWAVRHHPNAIKAPAMYGWIELEKETTKIKQVSVKKPLQYPANDLIVVGTFFFKKGNDFVCSVNTMIKQQRTVNKEYYVDECINDAIAMGLNCHIFEVEHYLCWGTPDELQTYNYWQACFHYWQHHSYLLELDEDVPVEKQKELAKNSQQKISAFPGKRQSPIVKESVS